MENNFLKLQKEIYEKLDNYKVKTLNKESDLILIFFSGNGLYFPNTEAILRRTIIENDRYEWEHISNREIYTKLCYKIIYVRDVYKQWYVNGISSKYSSITDTANLLIELTRNKRVYTIGNSAGGYAAIIFGSLLKADKIFSFSGQFYFTEEDINKQYLLKANKSDKTRNIFYDTCNFFNEHSQIYYFFPNKSNEDLKQFQHIKPNDRLYFYKIKSKKHGIGLFYKNYETIFFREDRINTLKNNSYTILGLYLNSTEYKIRGWFDYIINKIISITKKILIKLRNYK